MKKILVCNHKMFLSYDEALMLENEIYKQRRVSTTTNGSSK